MTGKKIIIDATGAVFGRLSSFAAKKALEGNEIIIVNSEEAVITGNKKEIINRYDKLKRKGGHSLKGPKYSNVSFKMLKRAIRGMIGDHRKGQSKLAFSRIKCYEGIPEKFKNEKMLQVSAPKKIKQMELRELSSKI